MFPRILTLTLVALILGANDRTEAEDWTNLRGTNTVEAEFIGLWQDSVVLQMVDGRRVTVLLKDLRSESRIQAKQMAEESLRTRQGRIKELQGQAIAAAAPAPNPLPKPRPARAYIAPKKGAKVGEFLKQTDNAILDGHLLVIYDGLPPSYQKDVDEIVQLGLGKISPETWQSIVGTLHQLGDLIVTKQTWFLSSPRVTSLPFEQLDQAETNLLMLADLLRVTLDPEAVQLEKVKTSGVRGFLAERDTVMAPHLAELLQHVGAIGRQISVESEKEGTAVVSISSGATPAKIEFTSVEGCWIPTTLSKSWSESITALKTEINNTPDGTLWLSRGMMLEPLLAATEPLKQAPNAAEFHAAMEDIFVPLESVITTVATIMGRNLDLTGNSRSRRGMSDEFDDGARMAEEEAMRREEEMQNQPQ